MKKIPIPSKKLYLRVLIDKVELLIKWIWWKALFFENESESTFNYGFKKSQCQPQYNDLMEFEDDLQEMISNVQFRRVNNDFQNMLKNDIRSVRSSKKIFIFADKTRNIYQMEKSHYKNSRQMTSQKHINNSITRFTAELIWKKNILQKNLK